MVTFCLLMLVLLTQATAGAAASGTEETETAEKANGNTIADSENSRDGYNTSFSPPWMFTSQESGDGR